jgi:hypothetical protein
MLETPDVQTPAEKELARLKKAQAEAHARWRKSPKGIAYAQKVKEKRALSKSESKS